MSGPTKDRAEKKGKRELNQPRTQRKNKQTNKKTIKKKKKKLEEGAIFANPPSEDPLVDEPSLEIGSYGVAYSDKTYWEVQIQ